MEIPVKLTRMTKGTTDGSQARTITNKEKTESDLKMLCPQFFSILR